jgi:hypothetical protein
MVEPVRLMYGKQTTRTPTSSTFFRISFQRSFLSRPSPTDVEAQFFRIPVTEK